MSCPTCSHTMQTVGVLFTEAKAYWCPRCGTLKVETTTYGECEAPELVNRCREFGDTLGPSWMALWFRLGIEEAILLPEDRRK